MPEKENLTYLPNPEATELLPQLTLDCTVLGFHQDQLRVLLLRWKGTQEWSLPGGPVRQTESVDEAAYRILKERTGLDQIYLQQFEVFGEVIRYNLSEIKNKLEHLIDPALWYNRAVSIGYYALVEYSKVNPAPDLYTDECQWWEIKDLPALLFDHNKIIEAALKALRRQLNWQPVGINLLPEKFTMPELQRLYEAILNRPLDPRNFHRKILSLNILERLTERRKGGAFKSPYLYRFNKEKYEAALEEGNLSFI
ncbi:DNA mismatch repair protein MutT [Adhaeribacter aerolatus]|uniref:DNA mismatch repair protein MutT n=1 Tax=Adhaeribacter aerolatus TaxID=670289 RepID=A0A512AYA1_9BACT|nr:NUDIX domain-containing protein [Adhaeribacter aerolatus]GEO04684.1 DNA mismatch repair protein MutT [Adhaeribacter aerolatus]